MKHLVFGFDLCDDTTQVSWCAAGLAEPEMVIFGEGDHPEQIATAVCRLRGEKDWVVGEDAARAALFGTGSIVDKLTKMVAKDGTATMEGIRYTAEDLMFAFLDTVLRTSMTYAKARLEDQTEGESEETAEPVPAPAEPEIPAPQPFDFSALERLVFTVPSLDRKLLDVLMRCCAKLGIEKERVMIRSHGESFACYTASQKLDIWANDVGLFDLSRDGLRFFRFRCVRGGKPGLLQVRENYLEESFSLDLLDTESGRKLADSILTPCAERMLAGNVYSAVLLSGSGFSECESWATGFLKTVCTRRRVFMTEGVFAKGAALCGFDSLQKTTHFPYRFDTAGRVPLSVSVTGLRKGSPVKLTLIEEGSNWYEAVGRADLLVNGKDPLELIVEGNMRAGIPPRRIPVSLADFPVREGYTTRVALTVSFRAEDVLLIEAEDLGFGRIFPATGTVSRQEAGISWNQAERRAR